MKRTTLALACFLFLLSSCKHSPYMKWQWHSKKSSKPKVEVEAYAPTINVTPESGAFNPLPGTFSLSFPDDLDLSHWSGEEIVVTGTGACAPSPLLATGLAGQVMTLTLHSAGCNQGDEIVIEVKENLLHSKKGLVGSGSKFFRLRLDQSYAPAPTLSLSSKKVSSLPISLDLTFDPQIDMSSVAGDLLRVTGTGACVGDLPVSVNKTGSVATYSFDPSSCVHSDKLELTVDQTKFTDLSGQAGSGTVSVTLELDEVGPALQDLALRTSSGNVNPMPTEVIIDLPGDVDPSTVTLSDFSLIPGANCLGAALTGLRVENGITTLGVDASGCGNGGEITLNFDLAGVSDSAGNSGTGIYSLDWTLISELPASPSWSVASATVSALPAQIDLTFASTVDKSSVLPALTVTAPAPCPDPAITGSAWTGETLQLSTDSSGCVHGATLSLNLDMTKVRNLLGQTGTGVSSRSFTFDLIGPQAPVLTPEEGSYLAIPSSLELVFPEDTDMNSVVSGNFLVTGSNGCPASPLLSFVKNQNRLTLGLDQACADGGEIQLSLDLSTVRDLTNNQGSGAFSKTFVTNSNLPSLPTSNRMSGTSNALPASIDLTFAADIDMASVEVTDFSVSSSGSCSAPALLGFSKLGQVATLSLDTTGCVHSNGLYLTLDMARIQNNIGTTGSGLFSQSFVLDTQGPASATLSPLSATLASLPTTLTFTFSSDTDMASVTVSDFALSAVSGCSALSLQSFVKAGQSATITVDPSSCANSDSFSVSLNMAQVQDPFGNAGAGTVSGTYTLDNQGPAAATLNLLSATRVTMPGSVIFTFSADTLMDSVTVSDFTVTGNGGCSASPLLSLSKLSQTATLNLNTSGCSHGSTISVSLSMNGVTDALGNPGAGSVGATYTLDTQGPAAATLNLASSILRALPTSVVYTFTADTDMSSVTATDFTVSSSGSCALPGLTGISKAGFAVTVNLNTASCAHGNALQVSLDMTKVSDALGNPGTGTVSSTYTLDIQGPAAATLDLASATLRILPGSVLYTFSTDTDMNTVEASDFTVTSSGACVLPGLSGIVKSGFAVTVNLNTASCAHGNTLQISLDMTKVADALGNPGIGSVSSTFTLDTQGPAFPTVNIAGGTYGSHPNAVVFTFPADTDMSTVTIEDFSSATTGVCTPTPISGFSKSGLSATISVQSVSCVLWSSITLRVHMSGITDLLGNPGSGTYSQTYTKGL